ncbi:MAG: hypothetical protein ACR2IK_01600 [Chloroflexota bacterium]
MPAAATSGAVPTNTTGLGAQATPSPTQVGALVAAPTSTSAINVATPTPVSAINATSGGALAAAGQAQTSSNNTQLSAGTVGGGNGSLAVTNLYASNVVDTSAASAQSGLSVALAPTVLPGTPVPAGVTTASSGNTSAAGLTAQNNVSNTSTGIVQVAGANQSSVSLTSSSSVDVKDTAASGAASGQAWAVAAGAAGSPSGVATPDAMGGAPNTAPASSMGLTAQNSLSSTVTATLTAAGGPAAARPISLVGSEAASVNVVALAAATSGPACSAAACATGAAPAVLGGTPGAQAASGSASAQGLTAQNTVNTSANVAVRVGGQNFAPIQVIVDSITRIFNLGIASATSGDATAGSGAPAAGAAPAQTASSGSAQASAGRVQNTVDTGASAAVRITGDNYNPISIILNLTTNLVNWGAALARSGDAQASGSGGGTANSGAAAASGMQVMNLVNMWANASVEVDGDNYAPIFVHITFTTNIDNRGIGQASSGNVAAGDRSGTNGNPAGAVTTAVMSGSGSSNGSGSVGSSSKAQSGNSLAVSNSVVANITSDQLSSANGSKPIASETITQMLRNLPSGTWDPFVQQNLPPDSAPAVENGLASRSGDATGRGLESQVDITNRQLVACKDPTTVCLARNLASLSVVSQDSQTNPATVDPNTGGPGPGSVSARVADALANATPTPTPTPKPNTRGTTGASVSSGSSTTSHTTTTTTTTTTRARSTGSGGRTAVRAALPANGHYVLVDLWDQWPGRRLPPMPNARTHKPSVTNVTASIDNWPGVDELPLPELLSADATPSPVASAEGVASSSRLAADLQDFPAGEVEELAVMELADVDPWGPGPDLEALPMPGQSRLAIASAAPSDTATHLAAVTETEDPGVTPLKLSLAGLLAALGGLIGMRRGRLLSALLKLRSVRLPTWPGGLVHAPRWSAGAFGQHTQRALAILRLTLGILRLW